MAWTYADWRTQTTVTGKRDRLAMHIAEVSQQVGPEVSADGKSKGSGSLTSYMALLNDEYNKLEQSPGSMTGGGFMLARMVRP